MIEQVDDQVERALADLLTQFKDRPNIAGLLSAFVEQLQQVENAHFQLLEDRSIDTAVGVQLDNIGTVVGRERGSMNDATYRIYLRAQIAINESSGTAQDILRIIALVDGGVVVFRWKIVEGGTAEFYVERLIGTITTAQAQQIALLVGAAKAAGVRAYLTYSDSATVGNQFFSYGPSADANGQSFGFDNGGFAAAIET